MTSHLPLAGSVALVTGGSSGIGAAVSCRLAAAGAHVAVVAGAGVERAATVAEEIRSAGGVATPFAVDVSDPAAVRALAEQVTATLGPIDIAVSSAGVYLETPVDRLGRTLADGTVDRMIDTNLRGVINVTAAVAPAMTARGSGHIVNVASTAGVMPTAPFSVYAATKAAVIAFTRATALELAPLGVATNTIVPGSTATAMNEDVRTDPALAKRRDLLTRTTPSLRTFTPPEETAELVMVLVDGRINGFHGAVLTLDEGRTAGFTSE